MTDASQPAQPAAAPPEWLRYIIEHVAETMHPDKVQTPIGFYWYETNLEILGDFDEPDGDEPGRPAPETALEEVDPDLPKRRHVNIFLPPGEIYSGPLDGQQFRFGFSVCISRLMMLFDEIPHVDWLSPVDIDIIDGTVPLLMFAGTIEDLPYVIQVLDRPPAEIEPAMLYDPITDKYRLKSGQKEMKDET